MLFGTFPTSPLRTGRAAFTASGSPVISTNFLTIVPPEGNLLMTVYTDDYRLAVASNHEFDPGQDAAGNWHVTVYDYSADPPDYDPVRDAGIIVADDTSYGGSSFAVTESAIPEFPTILAAIAVLALCAGTYLWMRRKAAPARA